MSERSPNKNSLEFYARELTLKDKDLSQVERTVDETQRLTNRLSPTARDSYYEGVQEGKCVATVITDTLWIQAMLKAGIDGKIAQRIVEEKEALANDFGI